MSFAQKSPNRWALWNFIEVPPKNRRNGNHNERQKTHAHDLTKRFLHWFWLAKKKKEVKQKYKKQVKTGDFGGEVGVQVITTLTP